MPSSPSHAHSLLTILYRAGKWHPGSVCTLSSTINLVSGLEVDIGMYLGVVNCHTIHQCVLQPSLNTAYMKNALTFKFSDEGSNLLPAEKQAYINFVDFLDECEG